MSKHHSHTPDAADPADAWHQHTADEHPQQAHAETVEVGALLVYGTAAFLIVVIATVLTIVYFYWYAGQTFIAREERFDLAPGATVKIQDEFNGVKAQAETEFKEYGWHDHTHMRIPLKGEGSATERVLAEYAKRGK